MAVRHRSVIPGPYNRTVQPLYDAHAYRLRHLIENTFARLKSATRIAILYDEVTLSFSAFVAFTCVFLWFAWI